MDIRSVRRSKNFSQDKLAQEIGVNRATLSKYETGAISPTIGMLIKIAKALDASLLDFFDRDDLPAEFDKSLFADPDDFEILQILGYAKQETEPQKALNSTKDDPLYSNLISAYKRLNEDGQREAVRSVEIIAGNPIYQRNSTPTDDLTNPEGKHTNNEKKPPESEKTTSDGEQ